MTDNTGNIVIVSPIGANSSNPKLPHTLMVGYKRNHIEDFDNFYSDWLIGDVGDDAESGIWKIDSPVASFIVEPHSDLNRVQTQFDHTTEGTNYNLCAFTGNTTNESAEAGTNDVDRGRTTLISPEFLMEKYKEPAIEYWRCYSNDMGANPGNDVWQVFISNDFTNWIQVERTNVSDKNWSKVVIRVKDYLDSWEIVNLKFVAQDSFIFGADRDGQSLIEAAIDDLALYDTTIIPPDTTVNPPDTTQNPKGFSEDITLLSQVRIFPVPAREIIRVIPQKNVTVSEIKIYNATGEIQYSTINENLSEKNYQISLNQWNPGIYFVEIKLRDAVVRKKFIVMP